MIFTVTARPGDTRGRLSWGGAQFDCAVGRSGVIAADAKREGDGATPLGVWPLRRLLYRPDRGGAPITGGLTGHPIAPDDGWCDAPGDPNYNRPVTLPYSASAEHLWLEDHIYDLVVVLGHNDDPPVSPMGSAIFLHLARPDFSPTQGCVALARPDLGALLAQAAPGDALAITSG